MVHFPTRIPGCGSHSPALLDSFLSSDLVFGLQWLSFHQEILIMLLSQFPLTFYHIHNRMPHFLALLMTILVLIGLVFMIIWEMFHGRISLNLVLLLLLVHFLVKIDVYIPHRKSQASLICMVFSCLFCCHNS